MQLPEMTLDAIDLWLQEAFINDRQIVAKEGENGCLISTYVKYNCDGIGEVSTGYGALIIQDRPHSRAVTEYQLQPEVSSIPVLFDTHLEKNNRHAMTRGTARKLIERARQEPALA